MASQALSPKVGGSFPLDYPGQGALPSLEVIQSLNITNGTFMPLHQIQGDIL